MPTNKKQRILLLSSPGGAADFNDADLTGDTTIEAAEITVIRLPTVTQAGHGFAVGDWVRLNAGTWVKAKADTTQIAALPHGVVDSVPDTDTFTAVAQGPVTLSGLTAGLYYLSDATAGLATQTAPTTTTSWLTSLMRAQSSTKAIVNVETPLSLSLIPLSAIAGVSTDGTLASDSDSKIPTEKAVKAYVDASGGGSGTNDSLNLSGGAAATVFTYLEDIFGGTASTDFTNLFHYHGGVANTSF